MYLIARVADYLIDVFIRWHDWNRVYWYLYLYAFIYSMTTIGIYAMLVLLFTS